jgi:hypothetical protein
MMPPPLYNRRRWFRLMTLTLYSMDINFGVSCNLYASCGKTLKEECVLLEPLMCNFNPSENEHEVSERVKS